MLKFPQVQKFLYFFELETGGIVIGSVKLVAGVLFMIVAASYFGIFVSNPLSPSAHQPFSSDAEGKISSDDHLKALTCCIGVLISFWVIYAASELIQGCRQRKCAKLKPAIMISMGSIVFNASLTFHGLPGCVFPIVVEIYNILVVYSLFRKIKAEGNRATEPSNVAIVVDPPRNEPLTSAEENGIGWVQRS